MTILRRLHDALSLRRKIAVVLVLALLGLLGWRAGFLSVAVLVSPLLLSLTQIGQCVAARGLIWLDVVHGPAVGDGMSLEGQDGTVEHVGLVQTILRGANGETKPVPNAKYLSDIIQFTPGGKEPV